MRSPVRSVVDALANLEVLFLGVGQGRLFDDGAQQLPVGAIQSDTTFHLLPSHCWKATRPSPSWLSQLTLMEWNRPLAPRAAARAWSILRFSRPQRTSSPVRVRLPNLAWAMRIASTFRMPLSTPRLW